VFLKKETPQNNYSVETLSALSFITNHVSKSDVSNRMIDIDFREQEYLLFNINNIINH